MKNLFLFIAVTAFGFTMLSFTVKNTTEPVTTANSDVIYEVPADVQSIIDNSCYGCHNSESTSTKGKMKLNFDKMPDLKQGKLIGKLMNIADATSEKDMPPKKLIAKYPEKALSEDEITTLSTWALETAEKNGKE